MKTLRGVSMLVLFTIYCLGLAAEWLAPSGYASQFREFSGVPPSRGFWLGTDALGRDCLSRLLYGSRLSLTLAPAAAALATAVALLVGVSAGYLGGWLDQCLMRITDLFLAMPWLFLVLSVRAVLPLNVPPLDSVVITFLLLGLLGWAGPARAIRAAAREMKMDDFMLQARARGCRRTRLMTLHLLPNLRPIVAAQFWMCIPVFILSETNLGFLGLGVAEPLPSWGNLLSELQNLDAFTTSPWRLAPLALLVLVMMCFHLIVRDEAAAS
jgi:peptide/nickel transport system permease protein